LIALAPTYFMLAQNRSIIEEALARENHGAQDERAEAFKTQALIKEMRPYILSKKSPVEIINEALKGRPPGITVDQITYINDNDKARVVLGGSGQSRDLINSFRKSLEATGLYSSVTVPVGDLVGGTGQFTITLTTK
jgi:hypothetical protein